MKNQGIPDHEFQGKPVIGICNTWSELTPCNAHFRELAESVKRGILEAGGFPLEFPVMSLGEPLMKPTTMLFRNLASMTVEETIRANPLDGVVLLCGCDKTTPSLVMGACSVSIPAIVVSGGAMLTGKHKGRSIGTSDLWRYIDDMKNETVSPEEMLAVRREADGTERDAGNADELCRDRHRRDRVPGIAAVVRCRDQINLRLIGID